MSGARLGIGRAGGGVIEVGGDPDLNPKLPELAGIRPRRQVGKASRTVAVRQRLSAAVGRCPVLFVDIPHSLSQPALRRAATARRFNLTHYFHSVVQVLIFECIYHERRVSKSV